MKTTKLIFEGTPMEIVAHNLTSNIDLELSRNCNYAGTGRCAGYCPKALVRDPKENAFLSEENFRKLIDDLVTIDYRGGISLVGYNEPLFMNIDVLVEKIEYIHKMLPMVKIGLNTNGALLSKKILGRLHKAGLNGLNLQIYRKEFSYKSAAKAMSDYEKKIGFTTEPQKRIEGRFYSWKILGYEPIDDREVNFVVYAKNLRECGCNRGGTVTAGGDFVRTQPCKQIGRFLAIRHNGDIDMCTNMVTGCKKHRQMTLGNLEAHHVWDAYENLMPRLVKMTKPASEDNEYLDECKGCNFEPHAEWLIRCEEEMQRK